MSDSYNCEAELRRMAAKLHDEAYELERAADVLKALREDGARNAEVEGLRKWARDWMKRTLP